MHRNGERTERRKTIFDIAFEPFVVFRVDDLFDDDAARVVVGTVSHGLVEELIGFLEGSGCVGLGIVEDEEKVEQRILVNIFVFGGLVAQLQRGFEQLSGSVQLATIERLDGIDA